MLSKLKFMLSKIYVFLCRYFKNLESLENWWNIDKIIVGI